MSTKRRRVDEAPPSYFTPVYRDAERRLAELDATCTVLRCGLYADFVLTHWVEPARSAGQLSLPVGQARIAPVRATMWRRQRLRQSPRAATPAKSTS